MSVELILTRTFANYPDAQAFIARNNALGYGCVVTNCNDGFLVDVYEETLH